MDCRIAELPNCRIENEPGEDTAGMRIDDERCKSQRARDRWGKLRDMRTTYIKCLRVLALFTMVGSLSTLADSANMRPAGSPALQKKPPITTLMYLVNRPESIASFREHADK